MTIKLDIVRRRLHNQHLTGTPFEKPGDVVAWLGAVQAQEYALAKWALGLRLQGVMDDTIEQAFRDSGRKRNIQPPPGHSTRGASILRCEAVSGGPFRI